MASVNPSQIEGALRADPAFLDAYYAQIYWSPLTMTASRSPEVQAWARSHGLPAEPPRDTAQRKAASDQAQQRMQARVQELGGLPHDYGLKTNPQTGLVEVKKANFAERNKDWIVPAVIGAAALGPFAAGALGGGAAAPAAATTPSSAVGPLGLPGAKAATIGAAPPVVKAASSGGWGKAIGELIPLGLQVAGNLGSQAIQSGGIDKAVAAQQAATDAAQARIDAAQRTSGDVYNQQRSDYQNVANVPFQALGNALGIPIADVGPVSFTGGQTLGAMAQMDTPMKGTWEQPITTPFPLTTGAQGGQTLAQMAQPAAQAPVESPQQRAQTQTASSYVRFRTPDGQERQIPRAMMQEAIKRGGTPLEA